MIKPQRGAFARAQEARRMGEPDDGTPAWVKDSVRLHHCVWAAREGLMELPVPDDRTSLLFSACSLGGEVGELMEALRAAVEKEGDKALSMEAAMEGADVAVYASRIAHHAGLPGRIFRVGHGTGRRNYPTDLEAYAACASLQNRVKKVFRDGLPLPLEGEQLAKAEEELQVVVFAAAEGADQAGMTLEEAVVAKVKELRQHPKFFTSFLIFDDAKNWPDDLLAAYRRPRGKAGG